MTKKINFWALTPLIFFVLVYFGLSVILKDFYAVPVSVAFLLSCVYAISITRGLTLEQRLTRFSRGSGNKNVMLMIWIFILAGAFATSAKMMGAVDATVNLTLSLLPASFVIPGLFLAACFISLSIGTSVGTIAALTPVAVGLAEQIGVEPAMITAVVVGGAFFGDNLSFISDTTVVATQTQGCKMSDKFKANAFIVFPAALIMLVIYFFVGADIKPVEQVANIKYIKVLPYFVVLVSALFGVSVMIVLSVGVLLTAIVGLLTGSFNGIQLLDSLGDGILGMSELIIVSLLAAGMLELIRYNGGIDYITQKVTAKISGQRGGEFCIGSLVVLTNICTANNTIAILTVGTVSAQIARKYNIDPRKAASILDTFSCFAQGLLPYGAQLLQASQLSNTQPVDIIMYLYYPLILLIVAVLSIVLKFPKFVSRPVVNA